MSDLKEKIKLEEEELKLKEKELELRKKRIELEKQESILNKQEEDSLINKVKNNKLEVSASIFDGIANGVLILIILSLFYWFLLGESPF